MVRLDLDRDQLAEVFGVETATIGSRLFRARQDLHERFEASGGAARPIGDELDDRGPVAIRRLVSG